MFSHSDATWLLTDEDSRQHSAEQVGETLRVPPKPEMKAAAWSVGT